MRLAFGFGGMRDHGGRISFDPRLPQSWEALTFRITLRGSRIRVDLTADAITFTVETGDGATRVGARRGSLGRRPAAPVTVALADQGPTIEGGLKDHSPHGAVLASGEQVGTS